MNDYTKMSTCFKTITITHHRPLLRRLVVSTLGTFGIFMGTIITIASLITYSGANS